MLIGLRQVIGFYSEEVIAEQVVGLIQEYSIKKKLGYFVFNNVTSNDTCVEAILKAIWPDLSKKKQKLRCVGHIINLAAQTFIAEVQDTHSLANIKKQLEV